MIDVGFLLGLVVGGLTTGSVLLLIHAEKKEPSTTIPPIAGGTEARVCQDIANRQAVGFRKYGTTVEDNAGDEDYWHRHLYEELLDAAVYSRRLMDEKIKKRT